MQSSVPDVAQPCRRLSSSASSSLTRASAAMRASRSAMRASRSTIGITGFALGDTGFALLGKGHQVGLYGRVVPAQLAVVPTEVEVEDLAVPVKVLRPDFEDLYGMVSVIQENVAGNWRVVAYTACGVETPVFRYAEVGVVASLIADVVTTGTCRGHLQHEVGRLPLIPYGVPILIDCQRPVYVEGDEQVGYAVAFLLAGSPPHRYFAQHDDCVVVAEMCFQGRLVGGSVQVDGVLHVVPGREVGELFQCFRALLLRGQFASHRSPRADLLDGPYDHYRVERGALFGLLYVWEIPF